MGTFRKLTHGPGAAVLFLFLLFPSFLLTWQNRDMPHFAYMHDDSVYYVTAKSIAQGEGLIIPSLPSRAAETKFPPALPYYQALSWLIEPRFPENLKVAIWLQWIWFPVLLILSMRLWRVWGFEDWQTWSLAAFTAINTFVFFGSASILTELPFVSLTIVSFLVARRAQDEPGNAWKWAALAGLAAAGAFLFRSIGVFLLLGFPGWMLWRRRFALAAAYAAPLLATVVAWTLFVKTHLVAGPPGEIYYTSYLGYHLGGFELQDVPSLLWRNLDGVTLSMGVILLPAQSAFPFLPIVVRSVAILASVGVSRLVRRGVAVDYAIFATVHLVSLIGWHQPNERMILPVLPLLLAGLAAELTHVGGIIRHSFSHPKRDQRVAAWVMSALVGLFVFWMAQSHYERMFVDLPELMKSERRHTEAERPAFEWARQNLPKDAAVLTGQDPLFYLFTDRRAVRTLVPLRHWYRDDTTEGVIGIYAHLDEYARKNRLDYVYWGTRTPLPSDSMMQRATQSVFANPGLEVVARMPEGTMFRVRNTTASRASR